MFVGLTNTPRDYAWGSKTAIAELLGREPSGGPEAEYWLGTHPGSPTSIVDGPQGAATLAELTRLPFIMKILAAELSVSMQAHPSPEQAVAGFARENALGIPLDAPERNYKDAQHKPELIYAVEDGFVALCGFRSVAVTRELLAGLGADPLVEDFAARLATDSSLRDVFEWLVGGGEEVAALRARVIELAANATAPEFETLLGLSEQFPDDAGVLLSLLLNHAILRAGQVIYLPAGNIHAYTHGVGIEVLAASDNVLRGGLTPKHVDVPELLEVLDFRPLPVPFLTPDAGTPGLTVFRPDVPDFELVVVEPANAGGVVEYSPAGDFIALCGRGSIAIGGSTGSPVVARGESLFGSESEPPLTFHGDGLLFLASRNSAS